MKLGSFFESAISLRKMYHKQWLKKDVNAYLKMGILQQIVDSVFTNGDYPFQYSISCSSSNEKIIVKLAKEVFEDLLLTVIFAYSYDGWLHISIYNSIFLHTLNDTNLRPHLCITDVRDVFY